MRKLDLSDPQVVAGIKSFPRKTIEYMQIAVFVMCGGGFIGRQAAEQPADFYIDTRAGRRPYPARDILQAVNILAVKAQISGLDPHNLKMPMFHNMGVF